MAGFGLGVQGDVTSRKLDEADRFVAEGEENYIDACVREDGLHGAIALSRKSGGFGDPTYPHCGS